MSGGIQFTALDISEAFIKTRLRWLFAANTSTSKTEMERWIREITIRYISAQTPAVRNAVNAMSPQIRQQQTKALLVYAIEDMAGRQVGIEGKRIATIRNIQAHHLISFFRVTNPLRSYKITAH